MRGCLSLATAVLITYLLGCSGQTAGLSPADGRCSQDGDCSANFLCSPDGYCRSVCNSSAHCDACARCESGFCVPVEGCDPLSGTTAAGVACAASAECVLGAPICEDVCRVCHTHDECELRYSDRPYCSESGHCASCLQHSDCDDADLAVCDAALGSCRACQNHDECADAVPAMPVCDDGTCVPPQGAGESCSIKPCDDGLKCDATSQICCSNATPAPCCTTANTTACQNNFDCNATAFTCYESCSGENTHCRQPHHQYCAGGTSCEPKKPVGEDCAGNHECTSDQCECINPDCADKACHATPCAACWYADNSDPYDTCLEAPQYTDGMCPEKETCDGDGQCKLQNGEECTQPEQCASGSCECTAENPEDVSCSKKICNVEPCPTCQYAHADGASCLAYAQHSKAPGCNAFNQACRSGGSCGIANGYECTGCSANTCASGHCVCANAACDVLRCHHIACNRCSHKNSSTPSHYGSGTCNHTVLESSNGRCECQLGGASTCDGSNTTCQSIGIGN